MSARRSRSSTIRPSSVACYMVRAPLSLKKLVYLDGQKAVLYRSKMNPSLGRNFEAMDPLDGWRAWPTTSPTRTSAGPICTASTPVESEPREERQKARSSRWRRRRRRDAVRRAGRGSSARCTRQTRSCAKAAEVRSRSCLHQRPDLDQAHPPPGPEPAGTGGAGADPGGGPCAGRRRGAGDPGRLSTATHSHLRP